MEQSKRGRPSSKYPLHPTSFNQVGDVISAEQLSGITHNSPKTIRKMAEEGKLPGRKIGGVWRFYVPDIIAFFREKEKVD